MVELPRCSIDFRIDELSPAAFEGLSQWRGLYGDGSDLKPSVMMELVERGMLQTGRNDMLVITFDGNHAQQRINCGIYAHHKGIYERRAARDAAMESMRELAIF